MKVLSHPMQCLRLLLAVVLIFGLTITARGSTGPTSVIGTSGSFVLINQASGSCVDDSGSPSTGTALSQWACIPGSTNQQWAFQSTGNNGYFAVANLNTSSVVWAVSNGGTGNNTPVEQATWANGKDQQWEPVLLPSGYYEFVDLNSGRCLDVPGGATTNGLQLQITTCTGAANQSFAVGSVAGSVTGGAWYLVLNATSGMCIADSGGGTGNGTALAQSTCGGLLGQEWQFQSTGNGYFAVFNGNAASLVWDDTNGSTANGNPMQLWTWVDNSNQQWLPQQQGDGFWTFVNLASGSCLDNAGSNTSGSQMTQWSCQLGNKHQEFELINMGATRSSPTSGPTVSVTESSNDRSKLLTPQPDISFTADTSDAATNTIVVDATQQYQTIDGFGAAFTDSAAYLLNEVAQPSQLTSVLKDLFTRDGSGIGLSFMRNPMGASDIARSVYSFDDQPVGTTDLSLSHFSLAHDQTDIIPIILRAKALNPQMKIMANPWSPPGWMKDPSSMNPVSLLGGSLLMTSANESAFANYFVKYIQGYQAAGINVDYISLQNEPLYSTSSYPSMGMNDSSQLALLQGYVLPALLSNNIATKAFAYDHSWNNAYYPEYVLGGLSSQQLEQMAGTAWHGYAGTPGAQQAVLNLFPTMGHWMTEDSGGTWVSDQFTSDFLDITQVMRNAGKAYVKWSLALDQNLGPNLAQTAGLGGCNTCTPVVTVNSQTGAITEDIEYYTLGQYSKYVLPGAVRIYSSNTPSIASVGFLNPNGTTALVAYNNATNSQDFQVQWGNSFSFAYTLPALSAATFTWSGTQSGPPITAAIAQVQASSYSAENGLQSERTSDVTGEYDLGSLTPGSYAVYKAVDFGTSVSRVSVREASGGSGGTASFYLDRMAGTPIATVNLAVTGGWQTWETVSAPVTGSAGVHTVYVVFNGSGSSGISNINWFQFQ